MAHADQISDALLTILGKADDQDRAKLAAAIGAYATERHRSYASHMQHPFLRNILDALVEGSEAYYEMPARFGGMDAS